MAGSSKKVIVAALIGNGLIAITKFFAASWTGSSAMLSEGIHSVVDTGNQVLLLWGLKRSARPADARYPFGHGREIYFWGFVVAILIFAVGAGLSIYEGIHQVMHPTPVTDPTINYVVLGLAVLFEGFALGIAFREFNRAKGELGYVEAVKRSKDPSMFIVLFEDSAAMAGLLLAGAGIALGQVTGNPVWDGVASIVIGLVLAATAIWLAYETKGLLIGESADRRTVKAIRDIASSSEGIAHVNEVLTMHMGPEDVLVNLSVDFTDPMTAAEMEVVVDQLDRRLREKVPSVRRLFVEAEARRLARHS